MQQMPEIYSLCKMLQKDRKGAKAIKVTRWKNCKQIIEINSVEHDDMFLGALETNGKCWTKAFFINGSVTNCKLDSGTEASVMSAAVFNKFVLFVCLFV